jgi:HrpA-like RNA helicase
LFAGTLLVYIYFVPNIQWKKCHEVFHGTAINVLVSYSVLFVNPIAMLQVKLLDSNCRIADFLKKTLDPPIPETVRNAIAVLQDLGALTQDEQLTELGEKLGSLPVHPSTTKMLLFAILMNCLDPALTLACAADYRDPFVLPIAPDERKRAAAARVELASLYGGFSDQLAVVAAFDCWRRAKDRGQESQFCAKYFVSSNIMYMLSNMRKQLQNELSQRGFIPADASACSLNSKDPGTEVSMKMQVWKSCMLLDSFNMFWFLYVNYVHVSFVKH